MTSKWDTLSEHTRSIPTKQTGHVEQLLNSQAKLLNAQAEATHGFGKAIGGLSTTTEELSETVKVLEKQLRFIDKKLDQCVRTTDFSEAFSRALQQFKNDLSQQQNRTPPYNFAEITDSIAQLRQDMNHLGNAHQQQTFEKLMMLENRLEAQQTEFAAIKNTLADLNHHNKNTPNINTLPEFDLSKERLNKAITGFEILVHGLKQDIHHLHQRIDNAEPLNSGTAQAVVPKQNNQDDDKQAELLERFNRLELSLKALNEKIAEQAQLQAQPVDRPSSQNLPEYKVQQNVLQKASINFGIIMQNFNDEVDTLKTLVQQLQKKSESEETDSPAFVTKSITPLEQKLEDIKDLIQQQQSNFVTESSPNKTESQLQQVASHFEQKDISDLPVFNINTQRSERLLVGFQMLLKEIKGLTDQYRDSVENIQQLNTTETISVDHQEQADNTVEKLNDIVANLEKSFSNITVPDSGNLTATAVTSTPSLPSLPELDLTKTSSQRFRTAMHSILRHLSEEAQTLQQLNQDIAQAKSSLQSQNSGPDVSVVIPADMKQNISSVLTEAVNTTLGQTIHNVISDAALPKIQKLIQDVGQQLQETLDAKLESISKNINSAPKIKEQHTIESDTLSQELTSLEQAIDLMQSYAANIQNGFVELQNKADTLMITDQSGEPGLGPSVSLADPLKNTVSKMQEQTSEFLAIAAALSYELESLAKNSS